MKTAAEISLYPLNDNYLEIIHWFIQRLDSYSEIERLTNGMSTQLQGDHDAIFDLLKVEIAAANEKWGRGVFVCKFIPGGVNLAHTE
ncbi:YkoF family thiamine/hydroxymethylpyrimidine-binding protein [Corallincola platygyrae]|uniref:YkoF family thiamine/hydroxymethylpyrimidine-binding protein n=1 Tax=Corallincola platygyrae TaxID=1193278 RepID=A0ABW4XKN4_9GAMM